MAREQYIAVAKTMITTIAYLKSLTPEAEASLGVRVAPIHRFPFRVGRESRHRQDSDYPNSRRNLASIPNNDLYLIELNKPLNVSREHFQIESRDDGFFLVDLGSACGTLVEGVAIGGERKGGRQQLFNGDVIIVGTSESRYIFKFILNQ
jgi:pSer/pThr/pTyr-binding forkhead associated (FHA) protein